MSDYIPTPIYLHCERDYHVFELWAMALHSFVARGARRLSGCGSICLQLIVSGPERASNWEELSVL